MSEVEDQLTIYEDLEDMAFHAECKITQAIIQFATAIKMGGSNAAPRDLVKAYLQHFVGQDFDQAYEEIKVQQMENPYNKILYRKFD